MGGACGPGISWRDRKGNMHLVGDIRGKLERLGSGGVGKGRDGPGGFKTGNLGV